MPEYKPRNRNPRVNEQTAPHSWSQQFYDSRKDREPAQPCGFRLERER